ncbi:polymorphic toxin-type HINT domain-containing protein [Paenibacillus jamilae]
MKFIDPSGNRYIPSDMNSILAATMKITSTESRAYSYAYNLLSQEFADVYDNNRFNYLFGLLTQTSAYKNSAGNADWARAELAKDYSKWHQEISFAEALASLGPIIGGIRKGKEVGGKVRAIGGCNCFTAGTKVLTDDGEKNIEDIEVGDKVLAKDENNPDGELAYKEVTGLYRNQRDDIIKLNVGEQIIETTDNHPFWVEEKGWVFADELQVGDKLQKSDGSNLIIDKVEFVNLDEPVTVYNFTVANFHTYYVTDLGIWVHNTNCYNDYNKILKGDNSTYKILKEETNWMKDQGMVSKGTINGRKTWYDGKYYYQWDSKKGALEKWDNKKKNHLGEFNAVTGEQSGKAVKRREWGK